MGFLLDDVAHALQLGRVQVELDPRIEILDVLAHDDEVDVAHRRVDALVGLRRPEVRVEVELLARRVASTISGPVPSPGMRVMRCVTAGPFSLFWRKQFASYARLSVIEQSVVGHNTI